MKKLSVLLVLAGMILITVNPLIASAEETSEDDWPMAGHDPARTGYTDSRAPDIRVMLWKFHSQSEIWSSPAVVNGRVYVGTSGIGQDKHSYAFDAENGEIIWRYETGGLVNSSPTVANGKVYVGSEDNYVYAVYADNGDLIWKYLTLYQFESSPLVASGKLYITDGIYTYALDENTSTQIWSYYAGSVHPPTFAKGKVYINYGDEILTLNENTGTQIWSCYHEGLDGVAWPVVAYGKVYVVSRDGDVYALNDDTGSLIWYHKTSENIISDSPPAIANGRIYISGGNYISVENLSTAEGVLFCLDADDGHLVWSSRGEKGGRTFNFPIAAHDEIFVGDFIGLYSFDANTGETKWMWDPGCGYPLVDMVVVAENKIFIGTHGHDVIAFGTPSPPEITQPENWENLSGTAEIEVIAYGEPLQKVELNWGEGWIEATQEWSKPGMYESGLYQSQWSHTWDTTEIPNGTYELRVRAYYIDNTCFGGTSTTINVDNPPQEEPEPTGGTPASSLQLVIQIVVAAIFISLIIIWRVKRH